MFYQDFEEWKFPRFIQGPYLKIALTGLTAQAKSIVRIMVPYLIQGEILHSILTLSDKITVVLLTRDHSGYLPNIKSGAQPALSKLKGEKNIQVYINNKIHAKIWVIDSDYAIVHSMNGTPTSESSNYEAGLVSVEKTVIEETISYFEFVKNNSKLL